MMVEQSLFALLSGITGGRMYPLTAPDNVATPYIVYQNISNSPRVNLNGSIPINNTRMQVDIYDKSYANVKALKAQIDTAMLSAPFKNVPLNSMDLYESEVKYYRIQQDYSIWY